MPIQLREIIKRKRKAWMNRYGAHTSDVGKALVEDLMEMQDIIDVLIRRLKTKVESLEGENKALADKLKALEAKVKQYHPQ